MPIIFTQLGVEYAPFLPTFASILATRVGTHCDKWGRLLYRDVGVGAALLWTLEQGLGLDFTPDVREAWVTAYGFLSSAMIAASSELLRGAA